MHRKSVANIASFTWPQMMSVLLTGLRASELRGLRWRDVDLKAAELHVRQRADRYNVMGAPKSESSVRTLPIPPEALLALKTWKLECPRNEGNLVFPTSTGHVEHHSNMLRSLAPVIKSAGLVDPTASPNMPYTRSGISLRAGASTPRPGAGASSRPKRYRRCSVILQS